MVKTGPARTLLHGSRYQLQQCSVSLEAAAAAVLCRVTDVFMNDWRGVAARARPGQARRPRGTSAVIDKIDRRLTCVGRLGYSKALHECEERRRNQRLTVETEITIIHSTHLLGYRQCRMTVAEL